jgi:hypothetical protein
MIKLLVVTLISNNYLFRFLPNTDTIEIEIRISVSKRKLVYCAKKYLNN